MWVLHRPRRRAAPCCLRDPCSAGRRSGCDHARRSRSRIVRAAWGDAFCACGSQPMRVLHTGHHRSTRRAWPPKLHGDAAATGSSGRTPTSSIAPSTRPSSLTSAAAPVGRPSTKHGISSRPRLGPASPAAPEAAGTATGEVVGRGMTGRELDAAAAERAALEGGVGQDRRTPKWRSGVRQFAADTAPGRSSLVAMPDGSRWLGARRNDRRSSPGRRQGAGSPHHGRPSLARSRCPDGDWVASLRTTWVEPAYLETDASWCEPGR